MGRGLSFRRHQIKRIKEKVKHITRQVWGMYQYSFKKRDDNSPLPPIQPGQEDPKYIGRDASTHCNPCSCHKCGNPRRYRKSDDALTKQEIISKISEGEQKQELNNKKQTK
jgi:hypothetical protein